MILIIIYVLGALLTLLVMPWAAYSTHVWKYMWNVLVWPLTWLVTACAVTLLLLETRKNQRR